MKKSLILFLFPLLLWSCAQSNAPLTGGAKDITAPRIDSNKTHPLNGETNFTETRIVLAFDEFIKLNKPTDNILITPQPKIPPTITAKNKKLFIEFAEELEKNTTYTISFNGAIKDITEGNDSVFQYVFSTGSYIDSLTFSGAVMDAETNNPIGSVLLNLYPFQDSITFDSIPYKLKPTYITQSGRDGQFQFNYLKEGNYVVFAIEDKNKNLLLNADERLAFSSQQIISIPDSTYTPNLRIYREANPKCGIKEAYFYYPGQFIVTGYCPLENFNFKSNNGNLLPENSERPDSLVFWLDTPPASKTEFYIIAEGILDTLKPYYEKVPEKITYGNLKLATNIKQGMLLPGEDFQLKAQTAISIPVSGVQFYTKDSTAISIEGKQTSPLEITYSTVGTAAAFVVIDSAAVQSLYGDYNNIKSSWAFESRDSSYFGNLILNIDTSFSIPVIVELRNEEKDIIAQKEFSKQLFFNHLLPGNYSIRLILDENNDGEWTTGSLSENQQPERYIYFNETISIKSKWDKEIDWNLELIAPTP